MSAPDRSDPYRSSSFPFSPPAILWIAGFALTLSGAARWLPLTDEAFDQAAYLFLGAGLPLAVLAVLLLPDGFNVRLKWLAVGALLVLTAVLFRQRTGLWPAALGLVQLAAAWLALGKPRPFQAAIWIAGAVLVLAAWLAASTLVWWRDWTAQPTLFSWSSTALLTATLASTWVCVSDAPAASRAWIRWTMHASWIFIFALAATRLRIDFHDEGFLVGTVELLRQGGWLLWDVPSQYGFLNLQWASWMPVATSWQAISVANSLLLWISAVLFYLRALRVFPGLAGGLFAGLLTLAAVLMLPGWAPELTGPNQSPSVGAFRFLWAYVLTEILLHVDQRGEQDTRRTPLLLAGCLAWVLACLWSFESAICATAIWLPGFGWMVLKKPMPGGKVLSVLAPAALLATALLVTAAIYRIGLGSGPDWFAYVEFLLAYDSGGIGAITASWDGAVSFLLGLFPITVAATYLAYIHAPARLPSALGALALFVTTSSYFMLRSHENNVTNLVPLALLATLTGVALLPAAMRAESLLLRLALVPFLAMCLFAAYGDREKVERYAVSLIEPRAPGRVETLLPELPVELAAILREAGLQPGAPLVFVAPVLLPNWPARLWLPLAPAAQFSLLPEPRRRIYLERFAARVPPSGWMLTPKNLLATPEPVVQTGLDFLINPRLEIVPKLPGTRTIGRAYETRDWLLVEIK